MRWWKLSRKNDDDDDQEDDNDDNDDVDDDDDQDDDHGDDDVFGPAGDRWRMPLLIMNSMNDDGRGC